MSNFLKYPHLEKYGNDEVEGITYGTCHIFPKIDGTNASVWFERWHDGQCDSTVILGAGSRNRQLSEEEDNAGFCSYVYKQCTYGGEDDGPLARYLSHYQNHILYGEWLVPHTIKDYRDDAWKKFYVFDVFDRNTNRFLSYDEYKSNLDQFEIDYVPCYKVIKNPTYENLIKEAQNSNFLMKDGCVGEGIVIKNYNWVNKYNNVTWAKLVTNEFQGMHKKAMGVPLIENQTPAQIICDLACTPSLIEKEYSKILNEVGEWKPQYIPRLLNTVYYSVVKEELWDCLKKIKNGSVNFQELQHHCQTKVKEVKADVFKR